METKNCQNCKENFNITPDDFSFYEKIGVPVPNKCPICRQQLRYAFRNERKLYRRNCDLCGKSTVAIYNNDAQFPVYCPPCWWGDGWDISETGRDFDFTRPFFDQYYDLQSVSPRIALLTKNSINSEYTHHSGDNKNCYLCTAVFNGENVLYSTNSWGKAQDCMDIFYAPGNSMLCYETIACENVHNCHYCMLVNDSSDCMYSYDLRNCTNCFLSYNLRNRSYCILNQQYTKEEYKKEIERFNLSSRESRKGIYEQYKNILENEAIHKYATIERSINSTGNFVSYSKNATYTFDCGKVEDSKYCIMSPELKNSMDVYHVGLNVENAYNSHGVIRSANVMCSHMSYDNTFMYYCDGCNNSQNIFGCVSVKKGEYMILNKKYSKEEYENIKEKIIEHMKNTGEWGEFFPAKYAPVSYNETAANVYIPLSKEEALEKGFRWQDDLGGTYGKETIQTPPDDLSNVDESITKEILRCSTCAKNFNVVAPELELYKRMNIPIPECCPDCRYVERQSLRTPRKLWKRGCLNTPCDNEFESPYSPDRPEKVYCEKCYQKEVL